MPGTVDPRIASLACPAAEHWPAPDLRARAFPFPDTMKADPHTTIQGIEQQLHAFRNSAGPDLSGRLIREYLGLVSHADFLEVDERAGDTDSLKTDLEAVEAERDEYKTGFIEFIGRIRGMIINCYNHPTDLKICDVGEVVFELRELVEDRDLIPDEIRYKIEDLPDRPKVPLGIDSDDEFTIPDFLIERLVASGRMMPAPGRETPAAGAERSAPAAPAPAAPAAPASAAPLAKTDRPKKEVPPATAPPVMRRNEQHQGIELRFNGKPDDATREAMKAHGFRWLPRQEGQPWAAKYTEERWVFATEISEQTAETIVRPLSHAAASELPDAPPPAPAAPAPQAERSAPAPATVAGFAMPSFLG